MKQNCMKLPVEYKSLHHTERKRVREEYIKLQGEMCYYCVASLSGKPRSDILKKDVNRKLYPPNFFKYPIHLHHSHVTGLTIGAVHNYCNVVLWEYEGE